VAGGRACEVSWWTVSVPSLAVLLFAVLVLSCGETESQRRMIAIFTRLSSAWVINRNAFQRPRARIGLTLNNGHCNARTKFIFLVTQHDRLLAWIKLYYRTWLQGRGHVSEPIASWTLDMAPEPWIFCRPNDTRVGYVPLVLLKKLLKSLLTKQHSYATF